MDLAPTRLNLHRVAAHVLGRARYQATGRFGLRAAPGGFAAPAFGDGPEVLRVAQGVLVRETATGTAYRAIDGTTLRDLAAVAGTRLDDTFSVGADTPTLGDIDRPLVVDPSAALLLAAWIEMGQRLLDAVCTALPAQASPAVIQLWPEHFDLATHVTLPNGGHANLGASLGDGFSDDPYLYVGPWSSTRPGEPGYWNAPFGAVRRRSELSDAGLFDEQGTHRAGQAFFATGLAMLGLTVPARADAAS